jgi:hypothetical protein
MPVKGWVSVVVIDIAKAHAVALGLTRREIIDIIDIKEKHQGFEKRSS